MRHSTLDPTDVFTPLQNALQTEFWARHIGTTSADQAHQLNCLGLQSAEELMQKIVPPNILRQHPMRLPDPVSEVQALHELRQMAQRNQVLRSHIGQGYYACHTPAVILRNVLENPAWYTAYTPYQAEISQGRMQALVNFQTLVCDLTGLDIANASMLDEASAAAEAITLARRCVKSKSNCVLVSDACHAQTIEVIQTRAHALDLKVQVIQEGAAWEQALTDMNYFAVLVQYPGTLGAVRDLGADAQLVHHKQAALLVATDLLALALLRPPGEWGADIAIGSAQRLGMPLGAGGPHAGFLACRDEFKRSMPGRLVGVSIDRHGQKACRLALQTREQHIRREKATSNICTAQALPAIVASMYAVYHGPQGLLRIAQRVSILTGALLQGLKALGWHVLHEHVFDTVTFRVNPSTQAALRQKALAAGVNLRYTQHGVHGSLVSISLDETTTPEQVQDLLHLLNLTPDSVHPPALDALVRSLNTESLEALPQSLRRTSTYLTHSVFNTYHSETAMLRYLRQLSDLDLALDRTMIPLGSCTMKLNATSEMIPVTWPEFAQIHPFAPEEQQQGYRLLDEQLRQWLCQATGYQGISLQPNAGSQGEYAGLLIIRAWQVARGQAQRDVCLIPASAHGTNPASAQMVGLEVVVTACDAQGNVDLHDLRSKCEQYSARLAAVMVTYPSTHGVFEASIKELCALVHEHGGRVYVDGANMNALVGWAAPGAFGGDVSHLNLHKTFCIPHGGGGPGVGPVCVVEDLVPFLPTHRSAHAAGAYVGAAPKPDNMGAISAAPLGNASVLPISWMYCRMMGAQGLRQATQAAILSANYISAQLREDYPTLYTDAQGWVAHECILDLRPLKSSTGVTAEDVAKRLIDYGFHAPTLSFPVPGTLMIEPTESESLHELDRFIAAMKAIRQEIDMIANGTWPQEDNPLKNAPHTAEHLLTEAWEHPYSRETAAYPLASVRQQKYWPPVGRVDNAWGDRNLFCTCAPVEG